jgi:hypothetical protein
MEPPSDAKVGRLFMQQKKLSGTERAAKHRGKLNEIADG